MSAPTPGPASQPPASGQAPNEHAIVTYPDDKYPHLVYAYCTCLYWKTRGAQRPEVVAKRAEGHLANVRAADQLAPADVVSSDPRTWRIEADDIVDGGPPGEVAGWECAGCQGVSGRRYGSTEVAAEALAHHQANEHVMPS